LQFYANFYSRKGRDLNHIWLIEGHNAVFDSIDDQGPIVNEWLLAGAGTGWAEDTRLYSTARDNDSASNYGLRQDAEVVNEIDIQETLDMRAASRVADTANIYSAVSLLAVNLAPASFADYRIGDSVGVEAYSYGVGGLREIRRVIGQEFRPRDGGCKLVLV
jgi:hypothetical protein